MCMEYRHTGYRGIHVHVLVVMHCAKIVETRSSLSKVLAQSMYMYMIYT